MSTHSPRSSRPRPAPLELNLGWLDLVVRTRPMPRPRRSDDIERFIEALAYGHRG